MASNNVTIQTGSIPSDFCFTSWQEKWPQLVALLSATLDGALNTFNYGNTTPTPDNRDKPWFRTNSDGSPDRTYGYFAGAWVSKHAMAPGSVLLYEGSEASITTFDGGESATVSATTGPMWEKVSSMDGRFPVGPGTFASGTAVAVGGTGGEEKHVLITSELPSGHVHNINCIKTTGVAVDGSGSRTWNTVDSDTTATLTHGNESRTTVPTVAPTADGQNQGHNNLPPYNGIYFIRRTARQYYRL